MLILFFVEFMNEFLKRNIFKKLYILFVKKFVYFFYLENLFCLFFIVKIQIIVINKCIIENLINFFIFVKKIDDENKFLFGKNLKDCC